MSSVTASAGMRVTGSTTWDDVAALRRELALLPAGSVIVTGDTPGADATAAALAPGLGLEVALMKKNRADHEAWPGQAWKGLNERMLATGVTRIFCL